MENQWKHKIFAVTSAGFEATALELFRFQYAHNSLYKEYADAVKRSPDVVHYLKDIPFLPIRFFKTHPVKTGSFEPEMVFESSGTTGTVNSKHFIKESSIYKESFTRCFRLFYGNIHQWQIAGLLPSYLERGNSSLVYMVNNLIEESGNQQGGFYLQNFDALATMLLKAEKEKQPVLLIGATYALLDFAERYAMQLSYTTLAETGGMKGRRKEMIRTEVHEILHSAFGLAAIHSEYGMTELLSQAWSKERGIFKCPPWMKVLIRDEEDPFALLYEGSGGINVIDFANIHSCSFIATEDVGRLYPDGGFEVLGRLDGSDLRGCSLLTL